MANAILVQDEDDLAREAARLLRDANSSLEVLSVVRIPETLNNGHIALTSQMTPSRFPGRHLRIELPLVYLREHPIKSPEGFRTAVLSMGEKLDLVPKSVPEKRSRKRNRGANRWARGRTRAFAY